MKAFRVYRVRPVLGLLTDLYLCHLFKLESMRFYHNDYDGGVYSMKLFSQCYWYLYHQRYCISHQSVRLRESCEPIIMLLFLEQCLEMLSIKVLSYQNNVQKIAASDSELTTFHEVNRLVWSSISLIKNKAGALRSQLHTECSQSEKVRV